MYSIDTKSLLDSVNGDRQLAVNILVEKVKKGEIFFPFQRYYLDSPRVLFNNLKVIDLPVTEEEYHLYSYYPANGYYLPPRFRGKGLVINSAVDVYTKADALSDIFNEHIRLSAKRYDQKLSVLEGWTNEEKLRDYLNNALDKTEITPITLRNAIYEKSAETKVFNPTWAIAILKLVMGKDLTGKKWLDISAGWGDRLISAMALNMEYLAFDPNINLREGHDSMIKCLGDRNKQKVIYEPFESGNIGNDDFDVVFSSPPYFDVEVYDKDQKGQSIVSFPTYDEWMVKFLFVSISKAWSKLKVGGYLILHLGDTKTFQQCEPANVYIQNQLLDASYEGVIGLRGMSSYARPVWVWKKLSTKNKPGKSLYKDYPALFNKLLTYKAGTINPDYLTRLINGDKIRSFMKANYSDLLISSLLENLGVEDTIKWLRNNNSKPEDTFEDYRIRLQNGSTIRNYLISIYSNPKVIETLFTDLLISSLLEKLDVNAVLEWCKNIMDNL